MPIRAVPLFAGAVNEMALLPLPEPDVTVNQDAWLTAVQEQPVPAVTFTDLELPV